MVSIAPAIGSAAPCEQGPTVTFPEKEAGPEPHRGQGAAGRSHQGGAELLAAAGRARKVVYVLDRSLSMGLSDALAVARREVLDSLRRLPPEARFQVVAYNETAEPLRLGGQAGLLPVEPALLDQAAGLLEGLAAAGESRHLLALQCALALQPDLLFLVTDADELTFHEVQLLTRLNQSRAVIHTLELTERPPRPDGPLGQLASANGGTYRCAAPRPTPPHSGPPR